MPATRVNAVGACGDDPAGAGALAGTLDLDGFAGKGQRDVNRARNGLGNPVAGTAERGDLDDVSHTARR
jgi:hypothetical protein